MTDQSHNIPYPAFAIAAGPFISKLAMRWGLGMLGRALVVGLGVIVVAAALSWIPARRTQRIGVVLAMVGLAAAAASLCADAFLS